MCQFVITALLNSKISSGLLKICFETGAHLFGSTSYIFILISPWLERGHQLTHDGGPSIPFICFIHSI